MGGIERMSVAIRLDSSVLSMWIGTMATAIHPVMKSKKKKAFLISQEVVLAMFKRVIFY
jgi:hypothetical protein